MFCCACSETLSWRLYTNDAALPLLRRAAWTIAVRKVDLSGAIALTTVVKGVCSSKWTTRANAS